MGVKQEIVKVPQDELVVAFVRPQTIAVGCVELEKDLAVHQQGEKLDAGKASLPPELADFLRRRQRGEGGCDGRIANPKQRAGTRRFQHHLIAASSQIGEARQHDGVGRAKLWHSRPIIRNLRFDDDLIVAVMGLPEAVLQQPAPGQPLHQQLDFPGDGVSTILKRVEWQALKQALRAFRSFSAELSQGDREVVEISDDTSVRVSIERDLTVQAGGNN